jgi:glucosamine-6-phosphate deaminase
MWHNLFKFINIKKESIHLPDGMASDIPEFCEEYERMIKRAGGIDIQVLGIGSNGHIAFNEPGSSLGSRTRIKTLTEKTINDNARFFKKKSDVPRYAITMGIGTIMEAKKIILLANGSNKAEVVAEAIEGPITAMVPASVLQMHPDVIMIIEKSAATQLKREYPSSLSVYSPKKKR